MITLARPWSIGRRSSCSSGPSQVAWREQLATPPSRRQSAWPAQAASIPGALRGPSEADAPLASVRRDQKRSSNGPSQSQSRTRVGVTISSSGLDLPQPGAAHLFAPRMVSLGPQTCVGGTASVMRHGPVGVHIGHQRADPELATSNSHFLKPSFAHLAAKKDPDAAQGYRIGVNSYAGIATGCQRP